MVFTIAVGIVVGFGLILFLKFVWKGIIAVYNFFDEEIYFRKSQNGLKKINERNERIELIINDIKELMPNGNVEVIDEYWLEKQLDLGELEKQVSFLKGIKNGTYDKIYLDTQFPYFNKKYLDLFR